MAVKIRHTEMRAFTEKVLSDLNVKLEYGFDNNETCFKNSSEFPPA
jgi:hypothetical protein